MLTVAKSGRAGGNMKCACWVCLFFVMSVAAVPFAGDIQVSFSPGLQIYLDGEFWGTMTRP